MPDVAPEIYKLAESLRDFPWEITRPEIYDQLSHFAASHSLTLSAEPKAIRGGRFLRPREPFGDEKEMNFVAGERTIAVIPARSKGSHVVDRVIFFPSEAVRDRPFSANLSGYLGAYATYVSENWKDLESDLGRVPLSGAVATEKIADGRWVTVTNYRDNLKGLGLGGFEEGQHILNTANLSEDNIRRIVKAIDAAHMDSDQFISWLRGRDEIVVDPESWINPDGQLPCFRGQEWWGEARLKEFHNKLEALDERSARTIRDIYKELFSDFDIEKKLREMIQHNLPLYPHVNGEIDNKALVGNLVVVHGTLYPDNIHTSLDSQTGKINCTITGGDRSQLFGLRGQEIDWLVASAAASPVHQKALVDEFFKIQKRRAENSTDTRYFEKEKRGLAMHVMYRCIMESEWFMKRGMTNEVENLAKLIHAILTGSHDEWSGVWDGVNIPMVEQR